MDSKTIETWALHDPLRVTRNERRDLDGARGVLYSSLIGLAAWCVLFASWS